MAQSILPDKIISTLTSILGRLLSPTPTATTGSITTSSTSIPCACAGYGMVGVQIKGTHAGINLTFEASVDGGTTYNSIAVWRVAGTTITTEATSGVITSNATRMWVIPVGPYTHVQVRSTAYTSGTGAITMQPGPMNRDFVPGLALVTSGTTTATISGTPNVAVTNTPTVAQATASALQMTANQSDETLLKATVFPPVGDPYFHTIIDGWPTDGVTTSAVTKKIDFTGTSPASASTVVGPETDIIGPYRSAMIYAELTGATLLGLLDIYLQVSPDEGVTWVDYAHFPQIAIGMGAIKRVWAVSKYAQQTTLQTVGSGTTPALAANTIVGGEFGDRMRVVYVAGAGTIAGASQKILLILSS